MPILSPLLFKPGFKFQESVCNCCHDFLMVSFNISDVRVITVKSIDYGCMISDISKSNAICVFKKIS